MRKFTDFRSKTGLDIIRLLIGAAVGVAVTCAMCFFEALLISKGILPDAGPAVYAAVAGFGGGMASAMILGGMGKILINILLQLILMLAFILLLGLMVFGRMFSVSANPFMVLSILFGIASGSLIANMR